MMIVAVGLATLGMIGAAGGAPAAAPAKK